MLYSQLTCIYQQRKRKRKSAIIKRNVHPEKCTHDQKKEISHCLQSDHDSTLHSRQVPYQSAVVIVARATKNRLNRKVPKGFTIDTSIHCFWRDPNYRFLYIFFIGSDLFNPPHQQLALFPRVFTHDQISRKNGCGRRINYVTRKKLRGKKKPKMVTRVSACPR